MDRDALVLGVLLLPRRRLHLGVAGPDDDSDLLAAQAPGAAAAVHRGVAAAQDDDALADRLHVPERHRGEPVDADVDVRRRFLATGDVELAAARRAAADEDRVVAVGEQRLHAVDPRPAAELDAEVEHVAALLVDHRVGQAELGNLRAHHPARLGVALEHDAVVAERSEVARDRQRRGARADERDALAVLRRRGLGQPRANVVLVVGRHPLQPADGDRFGLEVRLAVLDRAFLDATAAAGRLARAIAGASEDAGEDVRFPVDEIGVVVTPVGDQPYVLGNRGVGGTRPLAIDNLVEIVGTSDIRGLQAAFSWWCAAAVGFDWRSAPCRPARTRPRYAAGMLRHRRTPGKFKPGLSLTVVMVTQVRDRGRGA